MSTASEAQLSYIAVLVGKLGMTLESAMARHHVEAPLTVAGAGKLIRQLKSEVELTTESSPKVGGPPATLTPALLRKIANGEQPAPVDLDQDASWILYRLAKLVDIEHAIGDPVRWPGVNRGGSITVEHLIQYFGTIDAVASAFGVSIGTVKSGWSGVLPRNREFEAVAKTRGFVQPSV